MTSSARVPQSDQPAPGFIEAGGEPATADREPTWVAQLREQGKAGWLYCRLHGLMAALGGLFLVVVVSERVVPSTNRIDEVLRVTILVLWASFIAEFFARLALTERRGRFLRKQWWHLILLAIPFLNVVRAGAAVRITRLGRIVSASLRGTRSARSRFAGRVGTVLTVTVAVVLITTDIVFEFAGLRPYGKALHDVAIATFTGTPMRHDSGLSQTIEVFLAAYSAIFFASLAASLGAFFLERKAEESEDGDLG